MKIPDKIKEFLSKWWCLNFVAIFLVSCLLFVIVGSNKGKSQIEHLIEQEESKIEEKFKVYSIYSTCDKCNYHEVSTKFRGAGEIIWFGNGIDMKRFKIDVMVRECENCNWRWVETPIH